ncbi:hypothetical protein [Ligilactobacillus murinus]|uniref:hypothetical protein n=1 Tax=Ligilactobacillus murinus TaxID=1622 RepID=UPI00096C9B74|nr:hypothetical protein [Ligilactobacillus murinus]
MIFSPTIAETLIDYWEKNNTSGPQIALDFKKNLFRQLFRNKQFNYIHQKNNAEIFKYTHPSQKGNTQQLFEDFDYCSQGYGFSSADDIKQKFSIKQLTPKIILTIINNILD